MRPVPPTAPREAGAFRIRSAVSIFVAGWAWAWPLGLAHTPMWTTLAAATVAIRLARTSRDAQASRASLTTALTAQVAAGLYLAYTIPAVILTEEHGGTVALINMLLTS